MKKGLTVKFTVEDAETGKVLHQETEFVQQRQYSYIKNQAHEDMMSFLKSKYYWYYEIIEDTND